MRRTMIGALVAAAAVIAVVGIQLMGGQGRDVLSGGPGKFKDPPFSVRLDGPLWRARTLTDRDGAQDFALVARNLPLSVRATGTKSSPVAQVELRLDGRRKRLVVSRCPNGRCPTVTSASFVPPLRALRPGNHRVDIVVRDPAGAAGSSHGGEHFTTIGFDVRYVTSVPKTIEGQTIAKLAPPSGASRNAPALRRTAPRALSYARRDAGVAAALGTSRVRVVQIGPLNARRRRLGVTLLVAVVPPRKDVSVTVPAYLPRPDGSSYAPQQVRMSAAVLRDALIDVDLSTRKVIAFEPGPDSRSLSWSPSIAPSPAGASDED